MDNMKHRRLQELDHSDFGIVKGEPDIRGWDVRNGTGLKIGEVEELIVDAQQKKVRYMVVDLDDNELKIPERKVLIPIGLAELHKEHDDVLLPNVTVDHLGALPAYDKDKLDEETEQRICTILGRNAETAAQSILSATSEQQAAKTKEQDGNDFYKHEHFHDDNLYKNRLHEAKSANTEQDSEYERGLRLWELRSQGGIIPSDTPDSKNREEMSDEKRKEMIQARRKQYEDHRSSRGDKSFVQRIKDEGLQDAGQ